MCREEPITRPRGSLLRMRLSVLMFLQYAAPGALQPLFSLRLQDLGFTPVEIGWASATQAMAALVGPLAAGQIADRWWPAERCLLVCSLVAGGMALLLAELTTPLSVFVVSLLFWAAMAPSLTLGTTLCFVHLTRAHRQFGRVRLWGTVGWMASGWLLAGWFFLAPAFSLPSWREANLSDAFRLAGVMALLLAAYSLTLPHTPPQHQGGRLALMDALPLLRDRGFVVYFVCNVGVCLTLPFMVQVMPLLLKHLGIARPGLIMALTVSQVVEVASLAVLPRMLLRFSLRGTMLLGLLAWVAVMGVLTVGQPTWLVVASLACNGVCVCCFLVAGQVFVHSRAQGSSRTSAQAMLSAVSAAGLLAGNLLVGSVRQATDESFPWTFAVAAGVTGLLVVAFAAGFPEDAPRTL